MSNSNPGSRREVIGIGKRQGLETFLHEGRDLCVFLGRPESPHSMSEIISGIAVEVDFADVFLLIRGI